MGLRPCLSPIERSFKRRNLGPNSAVDNRDGRPSLPPELRGCAMLRSSMSGCPVTGRIYVRLARRAREERREDRRCCSSPGRRKNGEREYWVAKKDRAMLCCTNGFLYLRKRSACHKDEEWAGVGGRLCFSLFSSSTGVLSKRCRG